MTYNIIRLKNVDDGRFKTLLDSLEIKEVCFQCSRFDDKQDGAYMCAILGSCIGVTLSDSMKEYLLWKTEE